MTRLYPPRLGTSLCVGAAAGASLLPLWAFVQMAISPEKPGVGVLVFAIIWAFIPSFIVWLIGLTIFGLPAWIVLHRLGCRSWLAAASLGFATIFLLVLAMSVALGATSQGAGGWTIVVESAAACGIAGIVVAIAIWLFAYRPWQPGEFDGEALSSIFE